LERHEKCECSCAERGSDVVKSSVVTCVFRSRVRRAAASGDGDVEHCCDEEALGVSGSGPSVSRRARVVSQMGSSHASWRLVAKD